MLRDGDTLISPAENPPSAHPSRLHAWFSERGMQPTAIQVEAWQRYMRGESGLIATPTGSGKTLAAIGGPLLRALQASPLASTLDKRARRSKERQVRVLWITPLKALASNSAQSLQAVFDDLRLDWQLALRTGDASSAQRKRAAAGQAEVVLCTPESLALLMSYPDFPQRLSQLECVIVDEWHELIATKRGVLLQLNLSALRAALHGAPQVLGLSATLGKAERSALETLLQPLQIRDGFILRSARKVLKLTMLPTQGLSYCGHTGLRQLVAVAEFVRSVPSCLVFCNTRGQAELWFQALQSVWVDDVSQIALHHGSLAKVERQTVERALQANALRVVIATSSLDLGVDFPALDAVLQIGSPKSAIRLLQRAGRAKHRPDAPAEIHCLATHAQEQLEFMALAAQIDAGDFQAACAPELCFDVLAQHCVSRAIAGFNALELRAQVQHCLSFRQLSDQQWQRVLNFVVQGGDDAKRYPEFRRVQRTDDAYQLHDAGHIWRQRCNIGTIVSDGGVRVRKLKGGDLGSIDEAFITALPIHSLFVFAGRTWRLEKLHDLTAYVKEAKPAARDETAVVRWNGDKLASDAALSAHMMRLLQSAPEAFGWLDVQRAHSQVPSCQSLLVELHHTRDAAHICVFPGMGGAVHEAMAAMLCLRLSKLRAAQFSFVANEIGFSVSVAHARPTGWDGSKLQSTKRDSRTQGDAEPDHSANIAVTEAELRTWLSPDQSEMDSQAGINTAELEKRQFREIARISGLLPPNIPGRKPPALRQLQASSALIFDVFKRFDADHILLQQAARAVQLRLQITELEAALSALQNLPIHIARPPCLTPFAFPLWAERLRANVSSEDWRTQIERAAERMLSGKAAGKTKGADAQKSKRATL